MGFNRGPKSTTNGLVFYYDTGNVKSYRGEPTVNYVPDPFQYGLYAYASGPVDATVDNEYGTPIGVKRYTVTNAVNTARAAIFPTGLVINTPYTFSFKWKYNGTATTSPSVSVSAGKGNPEGGTNNNGFSSAISNTVEIGNGWYLTTYSFVFSSCPTGGSILTFGLSTGSNTAYLNETFDIYEAQFEIKDHRTQFTTGTRSATEGLIDLTRNSTINISNVTFDGNSQITFDGTNDYIDLGTYLTGINTSVMSIEIVFRTNIGTSGYQPLIGWMENETPHGYICTGNFTGFWGNESISFYNEGTGTTPLSFAYTNGHALLNDTNYHHVVFILQTNGYKIYVDGNEVTVNPSFRNGSSSTTMPSNLFGYGSTPSVVIGAGSNPASYANARIPIVKIYTQALTSDQVFKNFMAIKSRFNIS